MGFHWMEMIVIAGVALLVFGPKRLPEIGGAVGRTFNEFKRALSELPPEAATQINDARQPESRPERLE